MFVLPMESYISSSLLRQNCIKDL